MWDGWSPLARHDEQAFSVALSVLGGRVNDRQGRQVRGRAARRRPAARRTRATRTSTEGPSLSAGDARRAAELGYRGSRRGRPRSQCAGWRPGQLRARREPPVTGAVERRERLRVSASIRRSTSSCAPDRSMIRAQLGDLLGRQRRAQAPSSSLRASSSGSAPSASATSTVRLPSTRSSPAGLPVTPGRRRRRAGRRAAGTPRPAAGRTPVSASISSGVGPGQGRADVQRPLDGVLRGLVPQHPHRLLDVAGATCLDRDVEELADDHLAAGGVEVAERVEHPLARAGRRCGAARRPRTAAGRRAGSPPRRRTARGRRSSPCRGAPSRTRDGSTADRAGCRRRP